MTRFLGLVLLAVLLWICLEIAWARLRTALGAGRPPDRPQPPLERIGEPLARCAGCGVHVPRSRLLAGTSGRALCDRCRSLEARA
jgi:hypothetical protein